MRIPKRYGQSKSNKCPFCGIEAVFHNAQGIPVCRKHKDMNLQDLKCMCGEPLESRTGKFGAYFYCMNCGNVNFKRAIEVNEGRLNRQKMPEIVTREKKYNNPKKFEEVKSELKKEKSGPTETTVRSDELDFMFD
ncbi:MAG: hypothetical protein NT001_00265 [Candidatus Woesearchaeota archaeon]|nr:hypothetical protein [Candidatus Woesearchaeota archaeon]